MATEIWLRDILPDPGPSVEEIVGARLELATMPKDILAIGWKILTGEALTGAERTRLMRFRRSRLESHTPKAAEQLPLRICTRRAWVPEKRRACHRRERCKRGSQGGSQLPLL